MKPLFNKLFPLIKYILGCMALQYDINWLHTEITWTQPLFFLCNKDVKEITPLWPLNSYIFKISILCFPSNQFVLTLQQGRRQGVCLGGGGQNVTLLLREPNNFAPALKKGIFSPTSNIYPKNYHNGVGVLSSWPWLTAELTIKKKKKKKKILPLPPPVAPHLHYSEK